MAKREARGWKSYVPSLRGVVKILIVLVILKFVLKVTERYVPPSVQPYVPWLG
jgi:hypothetical protein